MIEVFADGCSLGNPGPAGAGIVIYKNKRLISKVSLYLGEATNNVAEYLALIFALVELLSLRPGPFSIYMDSQLIVNQVEGRYRIKNKALYPLNALARRLLSLIGDYRLQLQPYGAARQELNTSRLLTRDTTRVARSTILN